MTAGLSVRPTPASRISTASPILLHPSLWYIRHVTYLVGQWNICHMTYIAVIYMSCWSYDICCECIWCPSSYFCSGYVYNRVSYAVGMNRYLQRPPCDHTVALWYTRRATYNMGIPYVRRVIYAVGTWYARRETYSVGIWYARVWPILWI